ncbi:MAG: hypothetical protein R3336_10120, partial [Phycisphaeraceae bacterium]|nr:hypothetical protein [Phycisphaeraceae bacterium]
MTLRPLLLPITAVAGAAVLIVGGCASPLDQSAEQKLREQLLASHRAHLNPGQEDAPITLERPPSDVEEQLTDEQREGLEATSGPAAADRYPLDLGR